jgi:hypothetical protein
MKTNNKIKAGLVICFLSISIIGFAVPTLAVENNSAWMEKSGDYFFIAWWLPGWALTIYTDVTRAYETNCGHYYFSWDMEGYSTSSLSWSWTLYSASVVYSICPMCHQIYKITYTVHGRFTYYSDSSNYYDITLKLVYDASTNNIVCTFGPCIDHLAGQWQYHEDYGIETS